MKSPAETERRETQVERAGGKVRGQANMTITFKSIISLCLDSVSTRAHIHIHTHTCMMLQDIHTNVFLYDKTDMDPESGQNFRATLSGVRDWERKKKKNNFKILKQS